MASAAAEVARALVAAMRGGDTVVTATVVRADDESPLPVGAKMLLRPDGGVVGSFGGGPLEQAVLEDCRAARERRLIQTYHYAPDGRRFSRQEAEGQPSLEVLIETVEPPAVLLIVGGGHVGKALSQIGALLGFSVAVVDDRPEYASVERFPEADRVLCGDFVEVLREFPIGPNTYVVVVTRGHRYDEASLRQVVEDSAAYIGMIGSRRRAGAVLQRLVDDGVPSEAVARVYSPIGLDLGAETPEEIAVSIMAEIVQVRRRGTGRPMREVKRPRRARSTERRT
jgi:xanthine dehydrogenase accessory factor